MNEENNLKKYFIKDEELSSISEDKLSSKDVVKNITTIIDNTKPPFAIAVTGKSGIGKSSIINLVAENYNNNTDDYNVKKINAWKQDDCLKSILDNAEHNNQIPSGNNIDKNELLDNIIKNAENPENEEIETEKETKKSFNKLKKVGKFVFTFIICFIITTLIFALMEYIGNRSIYNNDIFFVENTYINYRDNFWMIMVFTIGLTTVSYIVNTLRLSSKKLNSKERTFNQYNAHTPIQADSNVKNSFIIPTTTTANSVIDSNKTNIIIVEDVDKLPAAKMLKTIEDLKHCTDYPNCIFIVTFDEKVLAKAIDVRNQISLNANYRPLKFEKIVDKVFQFKIYTPRIATGNIKEYAIELVKETIPNFIEEFCEISIFEKVIRNVLIYKNVTTPRHVKKLINSFINNKILVSNRVESGKISKSVIDDKNLDLELAKISVLQSDFEEFYNLLFKDFDYLEELTNLYCMDISELRVALENLDDELKPYINNKYRALMNFLVQTKNYKIENMSNLMYLTKVKSEKMYKEKPVLNYILGDEDISELRIQEVLELIGLIENKEDFKTFIENNFESLLEKYKENASNKVYFNGITEVVNMANDYIDEIDYMKYLEIVANNYNYYPEEVLRQIKNIQIEIPTNIMNVLIVKINESISKDSFDDSFEFLRANSDSLYEEDGNISEYVHFLVNNISLSTNPTEVIEELDDNFTRIGKTYDLYKNIQNVDNLDYDKAYAFIAKCLDNSDFDKTVNVVNSILSEENSVDNCIKIEEKMDNYKLVDIIECNVDDLITAENNLQSDVNSELEDETQDQTQSEEDIESALENANLLENNYVLLKNIIELCGIKQTEIDSLDSMKIIEKSLQNTSNSKYVLSVFDVLKKFDRMYFYEKRREYNEIIYACFHNSKNTEVKKNAIEITRYFKNTRLFLTKLTADEKKFYEKN